ncbi:MAG: GspE/PulE family protein [Saccharospirillum sp.]
MSASESGIHRAPHPQAISTREELLAFLSHRHHYTAYHPLGEIMVQRQLIRRDQLVQALEEQKRGGQARLGQLLQDKGWVDADDVAIALAEVMGLPFVRLDRLDIDGKTIERIPAEFAREHGCVPIDATADRLVVAVSDPTDAELLGMLKFVSGKNIDLALATEADIFAVISRHYDAGDETRALQTLKHPAPVQPRDEKALKRSADENKPVIHLVEHLLSDALMRRASDVHIRPRQTQADVLFRIDGQLLPVRKLNKALLPLVVSRIKVLGNMNLAEHRLPQDGRYRFRAQNRTVDLRLSVIPALHGESVVIRLLDTEFALKDLQALGYSSGDEQRLLHLLNRNQGVFLVTGPTGSGKSTTLYTALGHIRQGNPNIITVEDPVEYHLEGITQIQTHPEIGYTFARALRHILRHDPDVIMIGEIRDRETANMAVESALTGHLVLSTLHTNDAVSSIARLLEMGIESYLVNATVTGVLAQRLVRKNCVHCRSPEPVAKAIRTQLGVTEDEVFYHSQGCEHCHHTGVQGRVAVYELMTVSSALRGLIAAGASLDVLQQQARRDGMTPLTQHAVSLARSGIISLAEAYRVRLE